MKYLDKLELILINGGSDCEDVCNGQVGTPVDTADQFAQQLGEAIGEAIGNTIRQVGDMIDALWPF